MRKSSRNTCRFTVICALTCVTLFLAACGPPTSSLGLIVPYGVDLTGTWVLDESRSDAPLDTEAALLRAKAAEIDGKKANSQTSLYFAVQDFPVVQTSRMTIEQDADSIGISYGEGQYRDLIWGLQTRSQWRVDAGWDQSRFVVKSVVSHSSAVEKYALQPDAQTLVVDIAIRAGKEREMIRRIFVKAN